MNDGNHSCNAWNRKYWCSCPGLMILPGSRCPCLWVGTGQQGWQTAGRWASGGPEQAWSLPQAWPFPRQCWWWRCICPPLPHSEQRRSCKRRCLERTRTNVSVFLSESDVCFPYVAIPNSPCFLLTWLWGIMIWQELALLVLAMGWLKMQITRITWPTLVTRLGT